MSGKQNQASLHRDISRRIQGLIEQTGLKAGDRLPPERELAARFGVSRHSLREAIRTLEQQGLLKSRLGSGTYVAALDAGALADALAAQVEAEKGTLAEIFQFRRILEPAIAGLAAGNADEKDIATLEKLLQTQEKELAQGHRTAWAAADRAFHRSLARISGNSILISTAGLIAELIDQCRDQVFLSTSRGQGSSRGHARILDALKKKDPQGAAAAMEEHLSYIEDIVLK